METFEHICAAIETEILGELILKLMFILTLAAPLINSTEQTKYPTATTKTTPNNARST